MGLVPNTYKFEFQLEDAQGNMSNPFITFIEIQE